MPTRPLLLACLLALIAPALTAGVTTWSFDETTTGQDIAWTSPTSVPPSSSLFATTTTITLIEVGIEFSGIPFGTVDVTDQVPPEVQGQTQNAPGPAPLLFLDELVVYPEPPEPPAIEATVSVGLDASGFGTFGATDITLGTLMVDIGFPFGTVAVDITSLRVAGTIMIDPAGQWLDVGFGLAGTGGTPTLAGMGTLLGGDAVTYTLSDMLPASTATFIVGFSSINVPFKGGTLVPNPDLLIALPTGAGQVALGATWPVGVPSGISIAYQAWVVDAGAIKGLAATNGLISTTP